jgi:hypothetical protein
MPDLIHVDGVSYFVDSASHTCCRRDPRGVEDVVAGRRGTSGLADGATGESRLSRPESAFLPPAGTAAAAAGTLFIVDAGNAALRNLDLHTGLLSTVAATPPPPLPVDAIGPPAWADWGPGVHVDGSLAALTRDGPAAVVLSPALTSGVHEWEVRAAARIQRCAPPSLPIFPLPIAATLLPILLPTFHPLLHST